MQCNPQRTAAAAVVAGVFLASTAGAAQLTRDQLNFFENKIRPILADNCYKCHNAEDGKVKGGLALDTKAGVLKGGDTGPAVVPGDPDKSLLIKAISYKDPDLQMPPKGEKLTDSQIADLTTWVRQGAPDPREGAAYAGAAKGKGSHWAFQTLQKPPVPQVQMKGWVSTEVDNFILAKLAEKGMRPSLQADKRALIRRATFDLIGLPPTPQEVNDFLNDTSPDAFKKVVDHLLNSPHYGERWGRHWLDVARYSDTKGEINIRREPPQYPYAWTYRDYVVKSFNQDKPYDQFIREQVAADLLPESKRDPSIQAALGFLTIGNRFDGNANEIINDRIDVVTKGFLGLTVSCARCHDHMFDPIPQKDYYSMHGIFNSCIEPAEKPLLTKVNDSNPEYQDYLKKRAELDQRLDNFIYNESSKFLSEFRKNAANYIYLVYASSDRSPEKMSNQERTAFIKQHKLDREVVARMNRLNNVRANDPIMGPYAMFSQLKPNEFVSKSREIVARITAPVPTKGKAKGAVRYNYNTEVVKAFRGSAPTSMMHVAIQYGRMFATVEALNTSLVGKTAMRTLDDVPRFPDANMEALRWFPLVASNSRDYSENSIRRGLPQNVQNREGGMRRDLAELELRHPGAPARAMVLNDSPRPANSRVFIRGEANNRGDEAPRRFLQALAGENPPNYTQGSGRLELANSIASRDNPITARVLVNRVWMHHFGEGFVTTPDDFGTQSAPPTHPELLDYLAARFMEEGWSIKKLHWTIMLSSTYQQSSENNPRYAQFDPGNKLLWRYNVRRLEFEALRDSLLAIGGKLDRTFGGQPVDLTREPYPTRRTIYGYIDRANLAEVFNHFDFAAPDMPTGKRYQTIVPQQSLFLMNSPLVIEQARNLVQRPDFKDQPSDAAKVRLLYELVYQRPARPEEIKLGLEFLAEVPAPSTASTAPARPEVIPVVAKAPAKGKQKAPMTRPAPTPAANRQPLNAWEHYAHALLLGNEFTFIN
ncbi:MAG: PSD1 and planctomycete cytochrome C domain-containing protein [Verrucomicrobiota bacterium]